MESDKTLHLLPVSSPIPAKVSADGVENHIFTTILTIHAAINVVTTYRWASWCVLDSMLLNIFSNMLANIRPINSVLLAENTISIILCLNSSLGQIQIRWDVPGSDVMVLCGEREIRNIWLSASTSLGTSDLAKFTHFDCFAVHCSIFHSSRAAFNKVRPYLPGAICSRCPETYACRHNQCVRHHKVSRVHPTMQLEMVDGVYVPECLPDSFYSVSTFG